MVITAHTPPFNGVDTPLKSKTVRKGDVIQATELANDWCGCLLLVSEVKTWGVQAFIRVPKQGEAYIRLTWNQFERIGRAVMVPAEEADE